MKIINNVTAYATVHLPQCFKCALIREIAKPLVTLSSLLPTASSFTDSLRVVKIEQRHIQKYLRLYQKLIAYLSVATGEQQYGSSDFYS